MTPNHHSLLLPTDALAERTAFDPPIEWVLLRIRLRAQRRVLWVRELWRQGEREDGAALDFHGVVDNILLARDTPEQEHFWYEHTNSIHSINEQLAAIETAIDTDQQSRYSQLVYQFGLNEVETDLFQACLALHLDPQLERVFSYLQDHSSRTYVTASLVAGLFGHPYALAAASLHTLMTWELVATREGHAGEPEAYQCDPHIAAWLLRQDRLDPYLTGMARLIETRQALDEWPLTETVHQLSRLLEQDPAQRIRLLVQGAPGSGRRTFAACLARHFGQILLAIDLKTLVPAHWRQAYIRAQRMAYLGNHALAWCGEAVPDTDWPEAIVPVQLQFLICEEARPAQPVQGVVDLRVSMLPLRIDNRRKLWQELVPHATAWPAAEFEHIVHRYKASVGQIAAVARQACITPSEAIEVLRASTRHRLGRLAQVLECPFTREDLAIPANLQLHLDDFVFEARAREALWEKPEARRMFPQGKGLMALFTGSPGTGKTMAAQVVAAELELDLFRIDLSSVISKYIGETSKNIDQILTQARHMHAVLLFDEADTLFGKRTEVKDAHDRYANSDTNYLLQAIESYPGVAILASNKKSNIDPAFIRRLRYVFDFPKPHAEQRYQIWRQIVGELTGDEALQQLDSPLHKLAGSVELTGAQIKNSILSAVFIAQKENKPLVLPHLLRGLERELMKEGRHIGPETQKSLNG